MHYVTLYDAATLAPFLNLTLALPGAAMVATAVYGLRHPGRGRGLQPPAIRWLYLPFAVLWTVVAAAATSVDAARAVYWARTGQCTMLEGPVQHFHPVAVRGHGYETFDVDNVPFRYSESVLTAGFHFPGAIREGLPVRICYHDAEILRLEIGRQ